MINTIAVMKFSTIFVVISILIIILMIFLNQNIDDREKYNIKNNLVKKMDTEKNNLLILNIAYIIPGSFPSNNDGTLNNQGQSYNLYSDGKIIRVNDNNFLKTLTGIELRLVNEIINKIKNSNCLKTDTNKPLPDYTQLTISIYDGKNKITFIQSDGCKEYITELENILFK